MKRAGTALILVSLMGAAAYWFQPAPPAPPPEETAPPTEVDPGDAPHLLERFITRHEKARDDEGAPRFDREKRTGITEARLLGLSAPNAALPWLERAAADPARSERSREFAIRILEFLPDADGPLLRLAPGSASALHALCRRDLRGTHLAVYLAAADVEALSHWTDPEATSAVKRLAAVSDDARRMAERQDLLRAPDWAQKLEEILADPCHERRDLTLWALHVARSRALPGLAGALRDRLDAEAPDDVRDDILVALSELGGALTDDERSRLESFGYLGDPAARLAALLEHR